MNQKISIALAACKGEKWIGEQLESLLAQTLAPDEIVITDDSKTADTFLAVEPYMKQYPGVIRYERNAIPLGVSKNFERAIGLTTGDIIFLCDQDDIWLPEKVEKLAGKIDDQHLGAFCNSQVVDAEGKLLPLTHWDIRDFSAEEIRLIVEGSRADRVRLFLKRILPAGHNMAFSAKLKNELLPFPDIPECHDSWIGYVVLLNSDWAAVNEKLTLYRQHGNNVSQFGREGQFKRAIRSIRNNSFSWTEALFGELETQFQNRLEPELFALLHDRRLHAKARKAMNYANFWERLPLVYGEWSSGRYHRYGRGNKNVFQDLFLRFFI